jgi:hypothetical protein
MGEATSIGYFHGNSLTLTGRSKLCPRVFTNVWRRAQIAWTQIMFIELYRDPAHKHISLIQSSGRQCQPVIRDYLFLSVRVCGGGGGGNPFVGRNGQRSQRRGRRGKRGSAPANGNLGCIQRNACVDHFAVNRIYASAKKAKWAVNMKHFGRELLKLYVIFSR